MITLFPEDKRAMASVMLNLGHILGKFTTSSVFFSLNSTHWLNMHLYKEDKRTTPLITNQGYLQFMTTLLMVFLIYLAVCVPEKVSRKKAMTYKEMLRAIPLILSNRGFQLFSVFIILIRFIIGMLNQGISLKFIQHGVPKTTEVNIETLLMPWSLIVVVGLGWAVKRFKITRLMLGTFFVNNIGLLFLFLKFLVLDGYIKSLSEIGFITDIDSKKSRKHY